jgi:hypothetical protein
VPRVREYEASRPWVLAFSSATHSVLFFGVWPLCCSPALRLSARVFPARAAQGWDLAYHHGRARTLALIFLDSGHLKFLPKAALSLFMPTMRRCAARDSCALFRHCLRLQLLDRYRDEPLFLTLLQWSLAWARVCLRGGWDRDWFESFLRAHQGWCLRLQRSTQ